MFRERCKSGSVVVTLKRPSSPWTNTHDFDKPAVDAAVDEDEAELELLASLVDERVE